VVQPRRRGGKAVHADDAGCCGADVFQDVETQFTILHYKYQIFDEGWPAAGLDRFAQLEQRGQDEQRREHRRRA
jgi:hypothetical protein